MSKTILVVEDEPAIRELIVATLQTAGFATCEADTVKTAYTVLKDENPALILLDWMLPQGESGLDLVYRLQKENCPTPVIMLTAKGEESHKVRGFDAGVDDYITKPFSTKELMARIKAVLKRTHRDDDTAICVGTLCLNPASQRVTANGDEVVMSSTEFRLLQFFMQNQNRAYSREQILDGVWGSQVYIDERTVDVHIRRLRKILAPFGVDELVQTVRGFGYRFSQE